MSTDPLDLFHTVVACWFREAMGKPTPPQEKGWPVIASGSNMLLMAPTGSGKTLAAFLAFLDSLYRQGLENKLETGIQVVYISPLKALDNDIYRNLQVPLQGIAARSKLLGHEDWPSIDVQVRTGDTPSNARATMLKHPPTYSLRRPSRCICSLPRPRHDECWRPCDTSSWTRYTPSPPTSAACTYRYLWSV